MLGVEDYFKVEQIYILNAYFDETDKNRLIERLEGNKKRISDLYLKDDLQKNYKSNKRFG